MHVASVHDDDDAASAADDDAVTMVQCAGGHQLASTDADGAVFQASVGGEDLGLGLTFWGR